MKKILLFLVIVLSLLGPSGIVIAAPLPPVISHTTDGLNLTINWTSVLGATGYILSYAPNPYSGTASFEALDMGEETSLSIALWDGASYSIAVQSYNLQGNSAYSDIGSFTTTLVPAPPVISHTTDGLNLTIDWTSVSGATGYILSYAPNPFTGPETIGTVDMAGATSFSFSLWDGASYFIAAQSYNSQENSAYSNIDLFTISLNNPFVPGATYGDLTLIDENVSFTVFTSQELNVEIGAINVPLTAQSAEYKFVNIVVDLNANGSFASYSVGGDIQEEWVVQNVPLQVFSTGYNFLLDLIDPGVVPDTALDIRVVLTMDAINGAGVWGGNVPEDSVGLDVTVTTDELEWRGDTTVNETGLGAGGAEPEIPVRTARSGENTTAVDVTAADGSSLHRSGMPDGNQGVKQCVAQSIANNLSWLARRYNFTDKLDAAYVPQTEGDPPYSDEEKDHTTTEGVGTLADLINESFVALGVFNPAVGVTGTPGERTFARLLPGFKENFKKGKDKFVAGTSPSNKLPIETSLIEVGPGSNLFAEIKKAMKDDECAVELVVEVIDADGKSLGGHAVSVAGFSSPTNQAGSKQSLTLHDGETGNEDNNKPGNDVYPVEDDTINKFPFPDRAGNAGLRKAKLTFAIKQCYKPVEVSCLDFYGTYGFAATSIIDPGGHYSFIGDPFSSPLSFINSGGSQLVVGTSPFVDVSGTAVANGSCHFTGSGQGTVAGFSNISVMMDLTASPQGITGTYQMGSGGGLPGGYPITYTIEAL